LNLEDSTTLQFEPIAAEPTYRKVASALVEHIVAGRLQAGDRLPPELELARQFGVNRSTVREALRELDSAGLLGRRRGSKRMMVTRPGPAQIGAGVRRALVLHDVTFLDVWEALMILEPPLAAVAATRRSVADLKRLRATLKSVRTDVDSLQTVGHVGDFFRVLGEASGNPALLLAHEPLIQLLEPSLAAMIVKVPQARTRIIDAQRRLCAAIASHNSGAAQTWMSKHIRDFKRGYELAGIDLGRTVATGS
jgi:GntR family transcriptional regulator, transcriptional repressor for pyruvate dehydrogenase complex